MDDEIYEKYLRAGKIASEVRDYGAGLIKAGVSYLEVADLIESRIVDNNAGIAFPVNISRNDIAAHYSPATDDKLVFRKGDVIKLDVGVHIDGYIADTAVTVEVGANEYTDMIKASADALDAAIDMMKPGINLGLVGKKIEETIQSYDYNSVENLSGHSLECYNLHSGISVPNAETKLGIVKPKEGDVLAIEPFATNGKGHVVSGKGSNIYLCTKSLKSRFVRDTRAKIMFNKIKSEYKTLPFAERWLKKKFPNNFDVILRRLSYLGVLKHFPQLVEQNKGIVTQKEHTVILKDGGCQVTTL